MAIDIQNQILQGLLAEKLIDREQEKLIKAENKRTGRDIERIIADKHLVNEAGLVKIKGQIFNLPVVDLTEKTDFDFSVLNLLPLKVAENYQMVAFAKIGQELRIGLVDPRNFKAIEAAEFVAKENNLKNRYFVISPISFRFALKRYQPVSEEIKQALAGVSEKVMADLRQEAIAPNAQGDLQEVVKRAPIAKVVSTLIKYAVSYKASDIHIEPVEDFTRVRFRIDGILHTFLNLPLYINSAVVSRIKVLANLKLDETRIPKDGRIRLKIDNQDIDFRVSTLPLSNKEKVVIRILAVGEKILTLEELGFRDKFREIIEKNSRKTQGLFLVTGPTGSGKTTTLHTILSSLNEEGINIVTLEDPVEYYIDGVNQSQVNPAVGLTFANGLRSILRQDPDIIMVGEIRDQETVELAIQASLTGHAVYSTLHTNDSLKAIPRLIDMGAQPYLISATVEMVLAQRLARKICPDCRREIKILPELEKIVRLELANLPTGLTTSQVEEALRRGQPLKFFEGQGCLHCNKTGYKGRTVIVEAIDIESDLTEIIARGCPMKDFQEAALKAGFISFRQDGLLKCLEGVTTMKEVLRVATA